MAQRPRASTRSDIITLLTDFGSRDAFVGVMKGVMLGVHPRARLVDLTHEVEPHDIVAGALVLRSAVAYFPRGTVHLAVVDPGVGSARRALAIAARGAILIGPDNGLLSLAAQLLGVTEARVIDTERLLAKKIVRRPLSHTFHGRDLFAPVAAHVSKGFPLRSIGPVTKQIVELKLPACRATATGIDGEVIYIDRFGNLITNISAADLRAFSRGPVSVRIAGEQIRGLVPAYTTVPEGELLAIIGSWDLLEIAARGASAAHQLAASRGTAVRVAAEQS